MYAPFHGRIRGRFPDPEPAVKLRWLSAAALAACLCPILVLAELSATERRIVAAVRERSEGALQLLERAVRVNSGTMNPEGVREVGRIFAAELEALGFKIRWIDMPPALHRARQLFPERAAAPVDSL